MFLRRPEECGPAQATVRDVIDAVTSKAGLILGRFAAERKVVRDALREELRDATTCRSCSPAMPGVHRLCVPGLIHCFSNISSAQREPSGRAPRHTRVRLHSAALTTWRIR